FHRFFTFGSSQPVLPSPSSVTPALAGLRGSTVVLAAGHAPRLNIHVVQWSRLGRLACPPA
ncbi:MAG TPA: hypothetical protein VHI52_21735, partial [Verrucomicrobiae bacterium]|nr:hypothetical protein [Verrucomicrobiae bacterium]